MKTGQKPKRFIGSGIIHALSAAGILEGHQSQVRQRVAQQRVVLSIQDTTDLSFVHHQSKTEAKGFGLLSGQDYLLGLKVHSALAVSEQGVPLGILDQQVWARPSAERGKAKRRRQRSPFGKRKCALAAGSGGERTGDSATG